MTNKLIFSISLLILYAFNSIQSQEVSKSNHKKNSYYIFWGYNGSNYSNSNLHFNGPDYDFTVYDVIAKDKPTKLGWTYLNPSTITVPQYNFRIGYFLTDRFSISIGIDHMKYVVEQNQLTTISGIITESASQEYAGTYLNEEIYLANDLLKFEHTDGFNLVSLDVEYSIPFNFLKNKYLSVFWETGIGGIWIATKTNVKVLGDGLDNDFHIAGYTLAGKTGPRIEYKNRIFLIGQLKYGYASLPSVLIKNASPEIGDHNISYLEYFIAIGMNWKFGKKANSTTDE